MYKIYIFRLLYIYQYHVSAQGVDERMIDVHYYYYYYPNPNPKLNEVTGGLGGRESRGLEGGGG